MPKPSFPNDRSDTSSRPEQPHGEERSFPEPLPLDPPNTDHRPRILHKGNTLFPRVLWKLARDQAVGARELLGLIFLIDQTDGWPVLNRTWVRLTNEDWAEGIGIGIRGARKVRDSLLQKGLIYRKRDGNTYLYAPAPLADIEEAEAAEAPDAGQSHGFIYLAECSTGHFKIGKSTGPLERVQHFDTQMPVDVWLRHHFAADAYSVAERRLHRRYAEHRVNGEWFDLPDAAVTFVESITRFADGAFWFEESR